MRAVFAGRHDVALCMLLAVTLVALFHGAALGFELVWDDLAWINDFHRHTLASLLKDNFTANTLVSYYRPLVAASLNLQLALSHSPVFLHAFNLALHALNLCLLILIASPAMARGGLRQPLAVTVLAVHPVLVEPVVWVSGRFDLMFTSFVLLGLLAALRVRSTTRRGLAVALSFLAALCCKESALGPMPRSDPCWWPSSAAQDRAARGAIRAAPRSSMGWRWPRGWPSTWRCALRCSNCRWSGTRRSRYRARRSRAPTRCWCCAPSAPTCR